MVFLMLFVVHYVTAVAESCVMGLLLQYQVLLWQHNPYTTLLYAFDGFYRHNDVIRICIHSSRTPLKAQIRNARYTTENLTPTLKMTIVLIYKNTLVCGVVGIDWLSLVIVGKRKKSSLLSYQIVFHQKRQPGSPVGGSLKQWNISHVS